MSRLLKITDLGSGIMVQGTDNVLYPDNATLTYPYNSIVVVTDESDIATFRSASNNDVLFSGLIGKIEIGGEIVTKQNINAKFDAIANQESGGGGGDVTGLFADASYDSQTKRINFYDKDNTLVAYVDATDFIKDGMVSNVEISEGNLVITFNTDSGKEPIIIPLTDIFNPNNYYTKTEADNKFLTEHQSLANYYTKDEVYSKTESDNKYATQVVVNEEIAARIAGDGALQTALGTKADKSDTYTKTQVDDALALKQDASTAFSGDYDDLSNKPDLSVYAESANLATVATSGDYDDLSNKPTIPTVPTNVSAFTNDAGYLTEHQSLADYYTKSEVDTELADKQDALTAGANITIEDNVISSTGGTQVQADWNQTDDTAVDYIKNKPTIPDTSDFVSKSEYNPKEVAIAEALTDLNENKADKTEIPDVSTLATKTELNAKQDTLVSGTNIKTINNQSILGEGNIEIQGGGGEQQQADWNQSDTTAVDYIKNKPTIPAAQVNSDWNASSGVAEILNKPTIPVVPTNVSAFTNDAGYLTEHQSLSDYYTKTESDNKFALKFTDVDDIQKVSALPANPDSRTLYLIPVE